MRRLFILILLCAAPFAAPAMMPDPLVAGSEKIGFRVFVEPEPSVDESAVESLVAAIASEDLATRLAAANRTFPIFILSSMDERMNDPAFVVVLIHVAIRDAAEVLDDLDGLFLTLSARVIRGGAASSGGNLFPSAPEVVYFSGPSSVGTPNPQERNALRTSLARMLESALLRSILPAGPEEPQQ